MQHSGGCVQSEELHRFNWGAFGAGTEGAHGFLFDSWFKPRVNGGLGRLNHVYYAPSWALSSWNAEIRRSRSADKLLLAFRESKCFEFSHEIGCMASGFAPSFMTACSTGVKSSIVKALAVAATGTT